MTVTVRRRTSFEDRALLVKSLQHEVKHRSTRLEYIFRKSCIWGAVRARNQYDANSTEGPNLLLFQYPRHLSLLGRVQL